MKMKIVLELDVTGFDEEYPECIWVGNEGVLCAEAVPGDLVSFVDEAVLDPSHAIWDHLTLVEIVREHDKIIVENGKAKKVVDT